MLPPGGWSWGRIRITCTHVMSVIELVCTADCTLWVMWYFYSRVHWRLEVVLELGDHNLWAFWTQVQVSLWPWQSTVLYVKLSLSCWFCERKPGIFPSDQFKCLNVIKTQYFEYYLTFNGPWLSYPVQKYIMRYLLRYSPLPYHHFQKHVHCIQLQLWSVSSIPCSPNCSPPNFRKMRLTAHGWLCGHYYAACVPVEIWLSLHQWGSLILLLKTWNGIFIFLAGMPA